MFFQIKIENALLRPEQPIQNIPSVLGREIPSIISSLEPETQVVQTSSDQYLLLPSQVGTLVYSNHEVPVNPLSVTVPLNPSLIRTPSDFLQLLERERFVKSIKRDLTLAYLKYNPSLRELYKTTTTIDLQDPRIRNTVVNN